MTQDDLDKLLGQWAAQRATDARRANALADRIVDQLSGYDSPSLDTTVAPWGRAIRPRTYLYPALAASVALILLGSVMLVWFRSTDGDEHRPLIRSGDDTAAMAATVAASEIEASGRLFREMEVLFADRLRWIAESDSQVSMGVHEVSGGRIADATPLLIRVVVLQRGQGEASWRILLKTDVLTRGQELVEAVPDPSVDNRLLLWAYVLPDGNVSVDSNIRLALPIRAYIEATNILSSGKPVKLFSLQAEDAEYYIFQVVTPIPKQGDEAC
jgi:hypothetical protein